MFTQLQTLLAQVVSLAISMVANEDGTLTVTVIPKAKKDGEAFAALNTPLVLTGTPAELDAEFATILASYTSKRSSLAEQLEATEAVLEAAKKDSVKKATSKTATKTAAKPAKPAAEKACGDGECDGEEGDDDDTGSTGEEVAQAPAAPAAGTSDASNLWG